VTLSKRNHERNKKTKLRDNDELGCRVITITYYLFGLILSISINSLCNDYMYNNWSVPDELSPFCVQIVIEYYLFGLLTKCNI